MRDLNHFVCILLAVIYLSETAVTHAAGPDTPNVIVIIADDQGWGDLSLHNNANLKTANLDALALQGARFENFYVCPVCAPTRAEFLTGRYHPRSNVIGVSRGLERLNLDETTIADVFSAAGYRTAAFGKWHNGTQFPYHPRGRGFDEFYGFCSGHWGGYFSPPLDHNGVRVKGDGYTSDDFTQRAIEFMKRRSNSPFFVYLGYNTPHSPMQVPDRWWKQIENRDLKQRGTIAEREDLDHTRAALAMVENLDWNVGRILDYLDTAHESANTIVVYFSDNGPNGDRFNAGMRGRKGSTDEGGVRSPLFVRYPQQISENTNITTVSAAIDLLPTLTDLAGIPLATSHPLDGRSLAKVLRGNQNAVEANRVILTHWAGKISARNNRFRLDHRGRLYDITTDRNQLVDIQKQNPGIAKKLSAAVQEYRSNILETALSTARPYTIASQEFLHTQLPARDASFTGKIRHSCKYPNCSFLTDWNEQTDEISWPVSVTDSGQFRATLYYTCPPESVGVSLKLSAYDGVSGAQSLLASCSANITMANDPPLLGAERDRVPRIESYIKEFRPLELGTLELTSDVKVIRLTAEKVASNKIADIQLLELERIDNELN